MDSVLRQFLRANQTTMRKITKLRTVQTLMIKVVGMSLNQRKSLCTYSVASRLDQAKGTKHKQQQRQHRLQNLHQQHMLNQLFNKRFLSSTITALAGTERQVEKNQKIGNVSHQDQDRFTHFGYERIPEEEKVEKVYNVFENVADSYDLMNDVMSAGTHRLWKHHFVNQLQVKPGMKILDMAGGTGDIAFKMLDNIVSTPGYKENKTNTEITISDINKNMLDVGRKRAAKLGIENEFHWVQADAEDLPFEDESLDMYTIAFGIRNTTRIEEVLQEAHRVLKFGGRFSCLEFSHVENPIIRSLYDMYSFQVIPVLGEVVASDWNSYQYLVESIRQFPKQENFADMIYDAGFSNVMYENMSFGVVSIHDGFKI